MKFLEKKERERDGKLKGGKSRKVKEVQHPNNRSARKKDKDWREKTTNQIIYVHFSPLKCVRLMTLTWVIGRKAVPRVLSKTVQNRFQSRYIHMKLQNTGSRDKIPPAFPGREQYTGVTRRGEGIRKASGCWRANLEMGDNGAISTRFSGEINTGPRLDTQPSHKSKVREATLNVAKVIYLVPLLRKPL